MLKSKKYEIMFVAQWKRIRAPSKSLLSNFAILKIVVKALYFLSEQFSCNNLKFLNQLRSD